MTLCVSFKVIGPHVLNRSFINISVCYKFVFYKLPQPRSSERVKLVVICACHLYLAVERRRDLPEYFLEKNAIIDFAHPVSSHRLSG